MTQFNANATPTLATMQVGDKINYNGTIYSITSLGSYVNDGGGRGHRTVTMNDANTTTITVSTKDTTLSNFRANSPTTFIAKWVQTVKP